MMGVAFVCIENEIVCMCPCILFHVGMFEVCFRYVFLNVLMLW